MLTVYGIPNCDNVRRARKWLESKDWPYRFHDFRADGLTAEKVGQWVEAVAVTAILNRRGATWRNLSESERRIDDEDSAIALLARYPLLIKRPVIEFGGNIFVGFHPDKAGRLATLRPDR